MNEIFTIDELPKDYGGNGPSLQKLAGMSKNVFFYSIKYQFPDDLQEKFSEYQNRFDLLDKLRVNENLRPEPLINDEMLGFHGNFKKLNVD